MTREDLHSFYALIGSSDGFAGKGVEAYGKAVVDSVIDTLEARIKELEQTHNLEECPLRSENRELKKRIEDLDEEIQHRKAAQESLNFELSVRSARIKELENTLAYANYVNGSSKLLAKLDSYHSERQSDAGLANECRTEIHHLMTRIQYLELRMSQMDGKIWSLEDELKEEHDSTSKLIDQYDEEIRQLRRALWLARARWFEDVVPDFYWTTGKTKKSEQAYFEQWDRITNMCRSIAEKYNE